MKGNKEEDLQGLIGWVQQQSANGGTDFYRPVAQAFGEIAKYDYENAQLHVTDVAWLGTELLTRLPTIELKLEDK